MKEKESRWYLAQAYVCARKGFNQDIDIKDALHYIIIYLERFLESSNEYSDIEAYYYTRGEPEWFIENVFNPKLFTNEWRKATKKLLNDEDGNV